MSKRVKRLTQPRLRRIMKEFASSGDIISNISASTMAISGDAQITGSLIVSGCISASCFQVDTLTARSTIEQYGSTNFGDSADDLHQFTGSVRVDGDLSFESEYIYITSSTSTRPTIYIKNSNADNQPPKMFFIKSSSSPAVNDQAGYLGFAAYNNANEFFEVASIRSYAYNLTNGSENGYLSFAMPYAGATKYPLYMWGQMAKWADDYPVYFGAGSDSYIKYDEAGDDFMVISGSAKGLVLSGSAISASCDNFVIASPYEGGSTRLTFVTDQGDDVADSAAVISVTDGGVMTLAATSVTIPDGIRFQFGTGADVALGYDAGVDALLVQYGDMNVVDDLRLYFGTDKDSYIEYDETGDDFMVISGSAKGLVLSGSAISASCDGFRSSAADISFENSTNFKPFVFLTNTGNDASGPNLFFNNYRNGGGAANQDYDSLGGISFNGFNDAGTPEPFEYAHIRGAVIDASDGTEDGYMEFSASILALTSSTQMRFDAPYIEVGKSAQLIAVEAPSPHLLVDDNAPLYFGKHYDAYIAYDETSSDKLIISGASGGTYFSGSSIHVGKLGVTGSNPDPGWGPSRFEYPATAFDTITTFDLAGTAETNHIGALVNGQGGGDMIKLGVFHSGVSVRGHLVSLYRSTWYAADRSDSSGTSSSTRMLAVALDVDGGADEGLVLLRGIVRIPASLLETSISVGSIGAPVYISTTAGEYTLSVSTTSDDIIRIVGYVLDTDATDMLMYFCPDNTWIKVA
tara:strand:+ start:32834 stop:35074 length:2241 start_codon:yes stop_codon:yes gene_type:complete